MPKLKPLFDIAPLLADIESGTLILTPNNRLASKVLDAWGLHLQQQGTQVWRAPAVYAIENWISEQWQQLGASAYPGADAIELSAAQQLLMWEQVIEADKDKPPLLNAAGLAHSALRAQQSLQQWCIDEQQLRSYQQPGTELLLRWCKDFTARQQQLNTITRAELSKRVADALDDNALPTVTKILLVDFQTLAPLHQQLVNNAAKNIEHYCPPATTLEKSVTATFADSNQELRQAALWAKQKLQTQGQHRIGIIIPDLPNRRQQAERVFREVFEPRYQLPDVPRYTAPFNISTATPLASTPLIASALQLLKLNQQHQPLADYCAMLNSPFWSDSQQEQSLRAVAEKRLRELAKSQPRTLDFRECCKKAEECITFECTAPKDAQASQEDLFQRDEPSLPSLSGRLIDVENLRRQTNRKAGHQSWQELFSKQLEALGWPGSREIDSVEYQQLEHWQQLLEQFVSLATVSGPISLNTALKQLERLAQTTPFQAETEDSPLQILGLLEGAGLRFDHLWMMGMDDRQWPPSPEPNPLLPIELQRQHGMPRASAERELELAEKLLNTCRNRANDQIFSYCLLDGDAELAASRLIANVPAVEFEQVAPTTDKTALLEVLPIGDAPPLDIEREVIRGGSGILKDQANCPFNAFARWRLGAQVPMEPGTGLSPLERGIILHDVLDTLWEQLGNQASLLAADPSELSVNIDQISLHSLHRWRARKPELGERYFQLEIERFNTLIKRWLDNERERPPFTVAAREATVEASFAGLPLTLRIDRIDQTEQGETLLIDYKTGNSTIAGWLGDRPAEPQLPLYALLQDQPPTAISFGIINAEQQKLVGLTDNPNLIPGYKISNRYSVPEQWSELLEQWRNVLTDIAHSYCNGDAAITPYNQQAFGYQQELLSLNRWPEREQIERYRQQQEKSNNTEVAK